MDVPDGFGIFVHLTLIQLLADQYGVNVTGQFEYDGVTVNYDTRDAVHGFDDVVKRYGKTKTELEREQK